MVKYNLSNIKLLLDEYEKKYFIVLNKFKIKKNLNYLIKDIHYFTIEDKIDLLFNNQYLDNIKKNFNVSMDELKLYISYNNLLVLFKINEIENLYFNQNKLIIKKIINYFKNYEPNFYNIIFCK